MSTGWYGEPGTSKHTKVHFVLKGHPICGSRIGKRMQLQWCAPGFERLYVECSRCLKIALPFIGGRKRR